MSSGCRRAWKNLPGAENPHFASASPFCYFLGQCQKVSRKRKVSNKLHLPRDGQSNVAERNRLFIWILFSFLSWHKKETIPIAIGTRQSQTLRGFARPRAPMIVAHIEKSNIVHARYDIHKPCCLKAQASDCADFSAGNLFSINSYYRPKNRR